MLGHRFVTSIFLLWSIFAAESNGLIFSISYYSGDELKTDLEFWEDNHYQGTKEANLKQLNAFIKIKLAENRVHLIIESPFFYNIDCKNTHIKTYMKYLSERVGSNVKQWSFFESPREPSENSWIAWELPYVLLSVFSKEELPNSIELSEEQREHIINNVTVEFLDPRLSADMKSGDIQEISLHVNNNFQNANKSSPKKTAKILSSYVESRNSEAPSNTEDPIFLAHAFDIEALSSLMCSLKSEDPAKKIIVLCGHWHALQLAKIVPSLGFLTLKKYELNPEPTRRKLEF